MPKERPKKNMLIAKQHYENEKDPSKKVEYDNEGHV